MTKKETIELQILLSAVRSAASEIDYYSVDYDCKSLGSIADNLRKALEKFRKGVKI